MLVGTSVSWSPTSVSDMASTRDSTLLRLVPYRLTLGVTANSHDITTFLADVQCRSLVIVSYCRTSLSDPQRSRQEPTASAELLNNLGALPYNATSRLMCDCDPTESSGTFTRHSSYRTSISPAGTPALRQLSQKAVLISLRFYFYWMRRRIRTRCRKSSFSL